MSDVISRQYAIDAWDKLSKRGRTEFDQVLMTLPSAEPKTKCVAQIRIDRNDMEDLVNEKVNEMIDKMSEPETEMVLCALADRSCPFQGKEYLWCLTCPHISEEDMALVKKAVEEPKTGEWIRVGYDIYECSLCHQNVMTKDIDCYSYCHGCGAKMEGGDEE